MEAHTETLLDGPLRSILDREPIGVAVYRPEKHGRDFRYVYANPAFEALHPGTPTVGSSYAEVWPLVADTLLRLLTRVLETGQPWTGRDVPIPLETEPGVGVTHRYTLDISRVELGGKHHLLEIARDTTAEFEAGREIEAARDRLEDVLLRMSDGFLALDRDWRCTFVNERALRSLDKTREEVVGRSFWDLVPDGAPPVLGEQLHKVMDDGETVSFDLFNSATRRWSTVRSNPTSEGIAVFVTDITERKAAEERTAGLLEGERLGRTFSGLLAAASSELGATRTPQDLLPHILRDAGVAMGAVGSAITMRLPHGWRIAHGFGVHERLVGREFTDQQLPSHLRVLETGAPVVARDVRDAAGPNVRLADELAYRSFVINPLTFRQRVIGTLSFAFAEPTEHFPEIHLDFMARLAYVISASIEAERLFEERTEQAEYAEALNRINDAVHSTLEFDEIMERVVVETAKALDVDATTVHMHREGHWEFTYSHGLPEALRRTRLADADSRLSMRVMHTREPLVSNDVQHDERANVRLMERFGITSLVAVPLIVRDEVIGVLFSGCLGSSREFTGTQVDFTVKVAATLALALENARLYSAERDIADRLQESLLALPAHIPGIEFAHSYHSATETARVGGDFYDVFLIEEQLIGITVGDVAGKGLDAAVLTSLVKNAVRVHGTETRKEPARVLDLTNEVVYRATSSESFVTVFFAILDCRTGIVTYASAGHTTSAILRAGGEVQQLRATGTLLGAFPDAEYEQASAPLGRGEVLFMYTDGLTEARRGKEQYGEERLLGLLATLAGRPPAEVVSCVVDSVVEFTANRLRDDLAILAVQPVRG